MVFLQSSTALSGSLAERLCIGVDNLQFKAPPYWMSACVDPRCKPYSTLQSNHEELHVITSVGGFIGAPDDIAHSVKQEEIATLFLRFQNPQLIFVTGHEQCAGVGNLIAMCQGEQSFRPYYANLLDKAQQKAVDKGRTLAENTDGYRDLVAQLMILISTRNLLNQSITQSTKVVDKALENPTEIIPAMVMINENHKRHLALYDAESKEFVAGPHLQKLLGQRQAQQSQLKPAEIRDVIEEGIRSFTSRIAQGESAKIVRG